MMIYTIVDTIVMFWDVYNFMKENPEAWTFMKEKVAEWAAKAFSFMKDLLAFGKKLCYIVPQSSQGRPEPKAPDQMADAKPCQPSFLCGSCVGSCARGGNLWGNRQAEDR